MIPVYLESLIVGIMQGMKRSLLPFLAILFVLPASAEEDSQNNPPPVPSNLTRDEKTEILSNASQLLANAISYKGDGTAATIYRANGQRLLLEMRGLVIRQLIHGSVAIEEREAGITRRFYAQLHADAFRTSSSAGQKWTAWQTFPCPIFPSHMLVEEIDGKLTISAPTLASFSRNLEPAFVVPKGKLMPHERVVARR